MFCHLFQGSSFITPAVSTLKAPRPPLTLSLHVSLRTLAPFRLRQKRAPLTLGPPCKNFLYDSHTRLNCSPRPRILLPAHLPTPVTCDAVDSVLLHRPKRGTTVDSGPNKG